ncbi:MAG: RNA chaperone Hfq [Acidobacteria bacterium]|nr:RNA chaperone Hfq [Acidobacteriota bacterium]
MEKALPPNNIQDNFLNQARRERSGVTIYLISGVKLTGRIKSFDKYSLILEAGSQEQLIFKHAISTVSLPRGMGRGPSRPPMGDRDGSRHYGDRPHDSGHGVDRDPVPPPVDEGRGAGAADEA